MSLVPFRKTQQGLLAGGFDDFDRVFDNFFKNALTNLSVPAVAAGDVALRMNVSESENAYHVEAELPGVDEKDVELTLKDGILTLSGEKQSESETKDKKFHRIERTYGSFRRSLQLPADADENGVEAHMKDGVLAIEIGKIKEAQKEAKRIDIKKK